MKNNLDTFKKHARKKVFIRSESENKQDIKLLQLSKPEKVQMKPLLGSQKSHLTQSDDVKVTS